MITTFYDITLAASLLMTLIYVFMWHRHFDVHITLIFVLVPVVNLGYAMLNRTTTLEEALIANRLTYLGGCYLMLIITFSVYSLCQIHLNRWLRVALIALSTAVYLSALSAGRSPLFYKDVGFSIVNGAVTLKKVYGPMHDVFLAMIFGYFLMSLGAIVYSYLRKNQVSRKILLLLFLPVVVAMIAFFGGRRVFPGIELVPAAYAFALLTYLIIVYRLCLYDITDLAVDSLVQSGDTGLISIDFKFNYLGSNATAKAVFPALNELTVDRPITRSAVMRETAFKWLQAFRADPTRDTAHYEKDGRSYLFKITYLFDDRRKRGYQFFVNDDTENQRYIGLLNRYNGELEREVADKTAHIVEMHDKLILGMATMVESRDNSTGGHIRRASEGVRLLIDAIRAQGAPRLDDKFCRDIIKAAPMHDLGKIAVDDAVLRKPGRFTPEEFEKMKAHAAEGARIVHEILKGVEDDAFRRLAENVAHYHHERWDGSGYPEGLKGEAIPLEARIMAIADVYDALVSKRVYKESMSFDKADAIIMEGMGKHFDPGLEACYIAARPRLEAYYSRLEEHM